ncbi:MAG: type I-E CRISPR-associated protein Cas6/Cse3/CasE [Anaerolineales bacterium]|nr:type I-E CRISPR-associated protein Cas6/Cse3/CasE [Chloroflexota bacterium]MBL7161465.1 type I-E CRISPR-associated protein Cas6/Cse3/CasE [Anaerolineales bacterium]
MYLSRLILNPRSRQVRSELARPYQMHKTILRAFPETLPTAERVLFRLEEDPRTGMLMLLVQSQHSPDWGHLLNGKNYLRLVESLPAQIAENPSTKEVNLQLSAGQPLCFRLYANPTKKIKVEGKKNGQRVGIFKEEDQHQWLARKLEAAGTSLLRANTSQSGNIYGQQNKAGQKNKLTMLGVRFEGVLQVIDPQALLQAVNNGIGSGKGMGFGLLSLGPAR